MNRHHDPTPTIRTSQRRPSDGITQPRSVATDKNNRREYSNPDDRELSSIPPPAKHHPSQKRHQEEEQSSSRPKPYPEQHYSPSAPTLPPTYPITTATATATATARHLPTMHREPFRARLDERAPPRYDSLKPTTNGGSSRLQQRQPALLESVSSLPSSSAGGGGGGGGGGDSILCSAQYSPQTSDVTMSLTQQTQLDREEENNGNYYDYPQTVLNNYQERLPSHQNNAPRQALPLQDLLEDVYTYDSETTTPSAAETCLFQLANLCATAGCLEPNKEYTDQDYIEHDLSWNDVREWLQTHSLQELESALSNQDRTGKTALHFACEHQPPIDVVDYLLYAAPQCLEIQDAFGMTPLHNACHFSAAPPVLQSIAETWSQAKTIQNSSGLTPLHVAVIGPFRNYPDLIATLASTGANDIPENDGLLPLHLACAFGAPEETLLLLIDFIQNNLTTRDRRGRNPLHFALANANTAPQAAPKTVRLLLSLEPNLVNPKEGEGLNPFLFLLNFAAETNSHRHKSKEVREAIRKCLQLLLDAKPDPTPTVFTAIRSLPYWLFPTAILSETVRDLLNDKIKKRFPTFILIMDLYFQILVLVCYFMTIQEFILLRSPIVNNEIVGLKLLPLIFENTTVGSGNNETAGLQLLPLIFESTTVGSGNIEIARLLPLIFGASYFLVRELAQIISLIYLRSFRTFIRSWLLHATDLLDLLYIVIVYFWAFVMWTGFEFRNDLCFRFVAPFSAGILYAKFFVYLRSLSFDFSVYVSGVFYVARRLTPYIVGLSCFLLGFTQIFHTMFRGSKEYGCPTYNKSDEMTPAEYEEYIYGQQCETNEFLPFCTWGDSFLRVFTMFLGEVDEDDFEKPGARIVFGVFMFLMVILLANVLIVIVTNSYKVIQDQEAAVVFYTNRLHFLAETDAIAAIGNFPCFHFECSTKMSLVDVWAQTAWEQCWLNFELGPEETIFSHEFWTFRFLSILGSLFIIPSWFLLGLATLGAAWPPQTREWLSGSTKWVKAPAVQKEEELQRHRHEEESKLESQVEEARDLFRQGLVENRMQYAQIKASVVERKSEIRKEMRKIRVIMNNLFAQVDQLQAELADDDSDSS